MRRAGLVPGVDREGDATLAAPVELAERLEQERTAEALAPPGLRASPIVSTQPAPKRSRIDLRGDDLAVAVAHEVDERRIPVVAPSAPRHSSNVAVDVSPVVGERLLRDRVDDLLLAGLERSRR